MTELQKKQKQAYNEALFLWETSRFDDSLSMLRELVKDGYAPAIPKLLWRLWGSGDYYDEYIDIITRGINEGNLARLLGAGLSVAVMGTALYRAEDPEAMLRRLHGMGF